MTTCESSTNDHQLAKKPYNSLGKRKSSLVIKKKFAEEESSSNEEPLSNIDHNKRAHKAGSENKLTLKNNDAVVTDNNNHNKDTSTHHSL